MLSGLASHSILESGLPAWPILDLSPSQNWVLLKKCKLILILPVLIGDWYPFKAEKISMHGFVTHFKVIMSRYMCCFELSVPLPFLLIQVKWHWVCLGTDHLADATLIFLSFFRDLGEGWLNGVKGKHSFCCLISGHLEGKIHIYHFDR